MKNRSWTIQPLPIFIIAACLISALCALVFIGCGSTTDSEPLLTGIFADGVVEGLEYRCGDRRGMTDSEGKFYCKEDETVSFYAGSFKIGETDFVKSLTTPIDLVDEDNSFVLHPTVTNICRLLQSLDENQNPSDGIKINKETRDRIAILVDHGLSIDFALAPGEAPAEEDPGDAFFDQPGISSLITALNEDPSVFRDEDDNPLIGSMVAKSAANEHFFKIMAEYLATPVMMVNLGDSLTAGAQSGIGNIFLNTQANGYPGNIATQVALISDADFEHYTPLLAVVDPIPSSTSEEDNYYTPENGFKKRLYRAVYDEDAEGDEIMTERYLTPYNLGVPGATIASVRNTKTTLPVQSPPDPNDQNNIMTDLYFPIPELKAKKEIEDLGGEYNGTDRSEVTQLEAALFLANQEDHLNKLKIFTLWIGAEDTLGVITQNMGADLTTENITQFLSDHADYETDLQYIVDQLRSVEYAYVFIATIPKVETLGILFSKDDIIKMAQPAYGYEPDLTASGMTDELIGFKPFIGDYLNPDPNDPANPSISRCLANSEDEALLNFNIQQVLLTDANFLNQSEINAINTRIDEINNFIKNILATHDNVMVVDVNEDIYEKVGADGYDIIDELTRDEDRIPTHEEYLEDWGDIGIDPVLTKNMSGGFYSFDGYHPSYTGYGAIAFMFMNKIVEAGIGLDTAATFEFEGEEYPALDMEITDIQIGDQYAFDEDGDGYIYGAPAPVLYNYHYYDAVTMGGWADCGNSDETILPYFVGGLQGEETDPDDLYDADLDVTFVDFWDCMYYMPAYTE